MNEGDEDNAPDLHCNAYIRGCRNSCSISRTSCKSCLSNDETRTNLNSTTGLNVWNAAAHETRSGLPEGPRQPVSVPRRTSRQ